jgi:hypothetical protein
MNNYFTKLEKYKNKLKLLQNGGYLPNCTFKNTVKDNGEQGMCYMNGTTRINISPMELPIASKNNLIIDKEYLWVILVNDPTRIIYCDPIPGGDIPYFACNDPSDRYGDIHHNHIAQGQDIICGGEFIPSIDDDGEFYLSINNHSGHYTPEYECLITDQPGNPREPKDASVVFENYGYDVFIEEDIDIGGSPTPLPQPVQQPLRLGLGQTPPGFSLGQVPSGFGLGQVPQGFGLGQVPQGFGLGQAPPSPHLGFGLGQAPSGFGLGQAPPSPHLGFGLGQAPPSPHLGFGLGQAPPSPHLGFGLGQAPPSPNLGFGLRPFHPQPGSQSPNYNSMEE